MVRVFQCLGYFLCAPALAGGAFLHLFDTGADPSPKLLVFNRPGHGLLLFTNEARTRLAVGDAVGRTKFRLALQKEAGAGTPAEVPATLAELQANRKHSETPTQRSQANLALASHVRGALGALGRMPPSLDASFNNLFDLERGNQLPPYLVDDLEPPAAPVPAAAQPAQPYYGRVSVGSGTVRARACGTAGMVLACIPGSFGS